MFLFWKLILKNDIRSQNYDNQISKHFSEHRIARQSFLISCVIIVKTVKNVLHNGLFLEM